MTELSTVLFGSILIQLSLIQLGNQFPFFTDKPDGDLKNHTKPVPVLGGAGILLTYILTISFSTGTAELGFTSLFWVMSIVFVLGFLDDLFSLSAWLRLCIQIFVPLVFLLDSDLQWSFLALMLLFPFFINVVNWTDGKNGLVVSAVFAPLMTLSLLTHSSWVEVLIASLFAFGLFNFSGKIFLGDGGAYLLGALLATFVWKAFFNEEWDSFRWVLFGFSPMILDAFQVLFRRVLERRPLLEGDRFQLYDILDRKGYSDSKICGIYFLSSVVMMFVGWIIF